MFKSKKNALACFAALALSASCSDSKSQDGTEFVVEETSPSDSSGATGTMNVNFANLQSLGMKLADAQAPLVVGKDIELSYAKFNIAKIRVKALKDRNADEKTLESMESDEEKTSVKELEAEAGDAAAALVEKVEKSKQDQKAERAAKIAKVAAKFDAKEKAATKKESGRDKATKWSGPFVFDAIAGKLEGDLPEVTLLDGSYRRVEFQMKRNFSAAEGEAILGNVFAIRGTVLKAGVKVPFEIDWHVALNFRLSGDGAVTVKSDENNKMLIDFDLSKWFAGIDLTTATVHEDGIIYMSKSSNMAIMKQIHHNIKVNARFGKDIDKNNRLDDSEKSGVGEDAADPKVD